MSTPTGGSVDGTPADDARAENEVRPAGEARAEGVPRPDGAPAAGGPAPSGPDRAVSEAGAPAHPEAAEAAESAEDAATAAAETLPPSIPVGASAPRSRAETHPDTDEIEVVLPLSVVRVVPNPAHDSETGLRPPPVKKAGSTVPAAPPRPGRPGVGAPAQRPVAGGSGVRSSTPEPAGSSAPGTAAATSAPTASTAQPTPEEARRAARAAMSPGRRLRSAFRPRMTRAQVLAAVLCAVLGFALVVQLQQNQQDEFSGLRQSDLVRILDDVSKRSDSLEREATSLRESEFELRSGSDSQQAAIELAEKNAEIQGILSGRLPAEGPGLEIQIVQGDTAISAARLFNVLEELRNAGAEAIDVNGIRMVTSSYFEDTTAGVSVDGILVAPPYRWTVIGDPQTLEPAMAIPGGAMASITTSGGRTTIAQKELVQIRSVRDPADPKFAKPATDG